MRPLAFSTNAFKNATLEAAVRAIGGIGYGGVEVMADLPHALPDRMSAQRRRELAAQVGSFGAVSNINAFTLFACGDTYHPTWIEHDERLRALRIEHTRAALELAADLGAQTVSIQPGGPLIGTGLSADIAAERFARGIEAVLPHARRLGVTIAVEPEPGLLIQTAAEYLAFKRRFFDGEPRVRMNCDLGHLFCVGDDPADVIRSMPEQIAHVHLEDIGSNRVHQHLTPGRGVIDFGGIFAALRDIAFGGWVTVELYPYETSAAGVAQSAWTHLKPIVESAR